MAMLVLRIFVVESMQQEVKCDWPVACWLMVQDEAVKGVLCKVAQKCSSNKGLTGLR